MSSENKTATPIPGGKINKRPLHFFWLCDCSGSMSLDGKIQSLNNSIKEAIPAMLKSSLENPFVDLYMHIMSFSHGAKWLHTEPIHINSFKWTDLIADALQKASLDIVFMIDTSGSMGDEIEGVKKSCVDFADRIIKEGANVRLGLVGFDIGGHGKSLFGLLSSPKKETNYTVKNLSTYTIGTWKMASPQKFKENIKTLELCLFGGGGCYIASSDTTDIFPEVAKVFDGPSEHSKILVIISDEMGDTSGVDEIVSTLKKNSIQTFVMGVPERGGAHETIAERAGGKFWDITGSSGVNDFSSILGSVADTIAKEVTKKLTDGSVSSGTDMGAALKLLSTKLEMPPMESRGLPPVVIMVSDGVPTDNFESQLQELIKLRWAQKSIRLAIAIGSDADTTVLQKFIGNVEIKPFVANNSDMLMKYVRWVSTAAINCASLPKSRTTSGPAGIASDLKTPDIFGDKNDDVSLIMW